MRHREEFTPRFHDAVVFETSLVRIGAFRCDPEHAAFPESGPIANHCVWFARTPVVIQPEHEPAFVANANRAVFYNRAEHYRRAGVGAFGDYSDWFAIDGSLGCQIVEADRPFPWSHVAVDSTTYLLQRRLFEAVTAGSPPEPLAVEERVIMLVERAVAQTRPGRTVHRSSAVLPRHQALVHEVEIVLSGAFNESLSLAALAARVGTSVYHLCRVFRRLTGSTMHGYRQRLRLRAALEAVTQSRATLTQIAVDLGFASHSHFTRAFGLEFGILPSVLRAR